MKLFLKKSWPFIVLAILAFTIHLAFLSYPPQVVFDEVHFGKFVAAYFTGQYYFDIHPPLGKLMIAGFAKLAGANPVFTFDQIGEAIPAKTLFILRFLPAFFGGLFVLLFAWLAWLVSREKTAALIAGFLILLDNAFLAQSKFILVDIFLLFFEVLTFCFFFLWQRQKSFSAKWFAYLVSTGLAFGLTVSIKWTGLAAIGIIGAILFAKIFSRRLADYLSPPAGYNRKNIFKEFIVGLPIILIAGFLIYIIPFYAHFRLLPLPGPGDAFMSQPFQTELKYGRENTYQPLGFFDKFLELNKTMFTANASLAAGHPFGSRWYGWPLNHKPVYYWNQDKIAGLPEWKAKIYLTGNPLLWWLAAVNIVFVLFITFNKKWRRQISPIFYLLPLAYFTNLLPFILIKRVSFLYHYLPPVTFAILLLALTLNLNLAKGPADPLKRKKILAIVFGLILASFLALAPLSYGWPVPPWFDQFEMKIISLFG